MTGSHWQKKRERTGCSSAHAAKKRCDKLEAGSACEPRQQRRHEAIPTTASRFREGSSDGALNRRTKSISDGAQTNQQHIRQLSLPILSTLLSDSFNSFLGENRENSEILIVSNQKKITKLHRSLISCIAHSSTKCWLRFSSIVCCFCLLYSLEHLSNNSNPSSDSSPFQP